MTTAMLTNNGKPKGYGACPTWFWGVCRSCREGGSLGYKYAGERFAASVASFDPWDVENEDWCGEIDVLGEHLANGDDEAILAWMKRWTPRLLALVPSRRRAAFLEGVYDHYRDNGIDY